MNGRRQQGTARLIIATPPRNARGWGAATLIQRNAAHLKPWSPATPWRGRYALRYSLEHCGIRRVSNDRLPPPERSVATVVVAAATILPRHRQHWLFADPSRPVCKCGSWAIRSMRSAAGRLDARGAPAPPTPTCSREQKLHRIAANYRPEPIPRSAACCSVCFAIEGCAKDYLFTGRIRRDHILTPKVNRAFITSCRPHHLLRNGIIA